VKFAPRLEDCVLHSRLQSYQVAKQLHVDVADITWFRKEKGRETYGKPNFVWLWVPWQLHHLVFGEKTFVSLRHVNWKKVLLYIMNGLDAFRNIPLEFYKFHGFGSMNS
jgi:hypothetical protein